MFNDVLLATSFSRAFHFEVYPILQHDVSGYLFIGHWSPFHTKSSSRSSISGSYRNLNRVSAFRKISAQSLSVLSRALKNVSMIRSMELFAMKSALQGPLDLLASSHHLYFSFHGGSKSLGSGITPSWTMTCAPDFKAAVCQDATWTSKVSSTRTWYLRLQEFHTIRIRIIVQHESEQVHVGTVAGLLLQDVTSFELDATAQSRRYMRRPISNNMF